MVSAKMLSGLPPYGPVATAFPPEWARLGHEGVVVEFETKAGAWIGNFEPGIAGLEFVGIHPNKRHAIVIAAGDLWSVDPDERTAQQLLPAIDAALEVYDPVGWVFSRQGLAFARLGPDGLMWHTRRISWDGFDQLEIHGDVLSGRAYHLSDRWLPFAVNIRTGLASGGSYVDEPDNWESLCGG